MPLLRRLGVTVVLATAAFLVTSAPAIAAPAVTLLAPSNGQTIILQPGQFITYQWQVSWPDAPPQGNPTTYWELATDPSFSPGSMYGTDGNSCVLPNYACWTSYTAQKAYGPPWGRTFYWRIIFNGVTSAVGSFRVVLAPDLVKPRVRAYGGSARRGAVAHFMARAADDRGPVRYRATLEWRGLTVLGKSFPFANTVWSAPLTFYSRGPLPRRMPAGRYQFCITAWDQAANRARSCALYRIR